MKRLLLTTSQGTSEAARAFIPEDKRNEDALTAYFIALCDAMSSEAESVNSLPGAHEKAIPQQRYPLVDHQNKAIAGTSHKADFAFYYSDRFDEGISSVHLFVEAKIAQTPNRLPDLTKGQLLDYVNVLWTEQPTRTFVPILYIHGEKITLFVFTRGPWYRIELGAICHRRVNPDNLDVNIVRKSLLRLWFVITLPAASFGHFCDVDVAAQCIQFNRGDDGSKLATAILTIPNPPNELSLTARIPRTVNPRSRLAYLFDTTYNSKRAVLKLSWTPVKRLPESAVYEILRRTEVEGLPEVYDSGLLEIDAFGYRLEYIIIEHCGQSIGGFVDSCRERQVPDSEIHNHVNQFIRQVSSSLVQARVQGILHRDISDGNIAVRDGQAKVIDWGYAKIVETDAAKGTLGVEPALVDEISQGWGFDKNAVLQNEATWDPLTGTVQFMSVPVLFGMRKRSLSDDLESLFYVILYAFTDSNECFGFKHYDNGTLALTRAGILGCAKDYLKHFGVKDLGSLRQPIDAMLKYLFYSGGNYIGHELISNAEYERVPDLSLAVRFMDEEAVGMLRSLLPDDPVEEARSGTKRMRISNIPGADEAAGALPGSRKG
ncbi:hypothetical protein EV175_000743 [Coemansia sp. RSA 1933]|nr:hypothetical protein EV175_000743 [Coemansia sp. RSA 1933]